jgi:hypothetical protein
MEQAKCHHLKSWCKKSGFKYINCICCRKRSKKTASDCPTHYKQLIIQNPISGMMARFGKWLFLQPFTRFITQQEM